MKYTTIRIEGAILSADILDKIEQSELGGQAAKDFGFDPRVKVKDEIARAWADAQYLWRIFKNQRERVDEKATGTSETRRFWILPLLGLLGYDPQLSRADIISGKSYAISHRDTNRKDFLIHIMGFRDNLDKKRQDSGPRMSPHALVQEYINLTEHLYAIVTNGLQLRLLRDSSRLIKLSFIEFDLETMMEDDHYADFAIMYRLIHASRMPQNVEAGPESLIEKYHQDALDSGSRIREGLSNAVEKSIITFANGFLQHPQNTVLREKVEASELKSSDYYQMLLRLIYRILFLMVTEERHLIYPKRCNREKQEIYYNYYSTQRLRRLCEKRYLADKRYSDLWIAMKQTFRLFEDAKYGTPLDIQPLNGDLFGYNALDILNESALDNKTLLECLQNLNVFTNKYSGQKIRVNYASLNVEEFGSVYEGLLEYDAVFSRDNGSWQFRFVKGHERSASGSHYTPEELVQPLIKHSLDYIIEDRLKQSELVSSQIANSEVANSEIVSKPLDEAEINYLIGGEFGKDSVVSGLGGLAEKFESGGGSLSSQQGISSRGDIRNDESDQTGGDFHSGEYRRRMGEKLIQRIHSVSQDLARQSERIGNPSYLSGADQLDQQKFRSITIAENRGNWENVARTYLQSEKQLTIWRLLPDTTRYSLLATRYLLSITVCDVACGSGHFLLNAARRIGTELAKVRTGEDQPSPEPLRNAIRDVIRHCIYGVDKNPLAVELCKVALWLEAHNPGEPLTFLDHRIRCGDAIVGLAHAEELTNGIANEAFKCLPDDDKTVAAKFLKSNKSERDNPEQTSIAFCQEMTSGIESLSRLFTDLKEMPDHSPTDIELKKQKYLEITAGANYWRLKTLADIRTAQFFIHKTEENANKLITDATYKQYLRGLHPVGQAVAKALAVAQEKHFFHWFLEFPEVFAKGGFDCILGNPPFLGGQKISGTFGKDYLEYLKFAYAPAGSCDIVTYFYRRIFDIIRPRGFQSLLATNTIAQGGAREGGLDVIRDQGGSINHAVRSMKWPGMAAVEVSLVTIYKGKWQKEFTLDRKPVKTITTYLDDSQVTGDPYPLKQNENKSFQGSIVLGKGFVLTPEEARRLIEKNPRNKDVLFPYLNGEDLNTNPDQSPSRWVINFHDWPLNREQDEAEASAKNTDPKDPPYASDYPDCLEIVERLVKPERLMQKGDRGAEYWWQFLRMRGELYRTIAPLERVLVIPETTKHLTFDFEPTNLVFSHAIKIIVTENYYDFTLLKSDIHLYWVWKNSSTLESRMKYITSDAYETFPFPQNLCIEIENELEQIGKTYHEFRRQLMLKMQLGLTKTYNQFHNSALSEIASSEVVSSEIANGEVVSSEIVKKMDKDSAFLYKHLQRTPGTYSFNEAVRDIFSLRELHKQMDLAVLKAYGWEDIDLAHDFYEVDYLPENDRIRYTISPAARREVLKRLLELNHKIHEEEVAAGLWDKKGRGMKENKKQISAFDE
jgi:hypothetical protein